MRFVIRIILFAVLLMGAHVALAQNKPASPRGQAATQIGQHWVEVDYSRPILRGRTNIFGEGSSYGEQVNANAPVWRLGANKSTRLTTEVDLAFGDHALPAGEYSLFVDLQGSDSWTLIVSNHAAKNSFRGDGDGLWGSYGYSADQDVLRVPMMVGQQSISADQLTITFGDVSDSGGKLVIWWDKTMASVPFSIAN